jgi:hypothetical protein
LRHVQVGGGDLENLIVAYLFKKLPAFMEPEVSLQCPQEPAICIYPEPNESSRHYHILFEINFNIILPYII